MDASTRRVLWIGGLVAGAAALVGGTYLLTKPPPAPAGGTASVNVQLPPAGSTTPPTVNIPGVTSPVPTATGG